MEEQGLVTIWNIINTGGIVAVLSLNVWLLVRGELLPRKVYEDLTTRILKEMCSEITVAFRQIFREERQREQDKEG